MSFKTWSFGQMQSVEDIRTEIEGFPLEVRKEILWMLEQSICDEQARLAEENLKAALQLVTCRIINHDRGDSHPIRFSDMKSIAFEG